MSSPSQPSSGSEPQPAQPESAQDRSGIDTATDVEIQRRFNELQRELLDHRVKLADWWLTAMAGFLTFFGVVAVIVGFFGFEELRDFKDKAHEYMIAANKHAGEAEKQAMRAEHAVKEIEATHDEAQALLKGMNAETVHNDPDKASEVVETVQQSPVASPIDRAVAAAISLQQQGKAEEAIKKWSSIANVAEGVDRQLQARAWFSVGYLNSEEDNWKEAIDAYNEAIQLNPDMAEAYNNRGVARNDLGEYEAALVDLNEAIQLKPDQAEAYNNRGVTKKALGRLDEAREDYQKALALAQESGKEDVIAAAKRNLSRLDNDPTP